MWSKHITAMFSHINARLNERFVWVMAIKAKNKPIDKDEWRRIMTFKCVTG